MYGRSTGALFLAELKLITPGGLKKAILFLKLAMDKAMKDNGGFPTQDQIIAAGKGMEFQSFGGMVQMALGDGHQAIHPVGYGITKFNKDKGEPGAENVKFYSAECINPPAGTLSADWLAAGMPGAKC